MEAAKWRLQSLWRTLLRACKIVALFALFLDKKPIKRVLSSNYTKQGILPNYMRLIAKPSFSSKPFIAWANIALAEWADSLYEDLVLFGKDIHVYVGEHEGKIIAGCFLSHTFVNEPKVPATDALLKSYQAKQYLNLSYFIVEAQLRGKGLGTAFLKELFLQLPNQGFWLECDKEMIPLYKRAGFELLLDEPDDEGNFYMVAYSSASLAASSAQPHAAV